MKRKLKSICRKAWGQGCPCLVIVGKSTTMTRGKNMPFIFCKLLKGGLFATLCLRWPGSKWRNWILVGRRWQCSVNCRTNTVSVSFIPGRSPGDFSGSFQWNTWHTVVIRTSDTSTLKTSKIFQEYLEQDASQGCNLVYFNVSNPSKWKAFLSCTFYKESLPLLKCPWRPLSSIHVAISYHSFSCTLDPISWGEGGFRAWMSH